MITHLKCILAGTFLVMTIVLTGCNTVQGVGKDIQAAGNVGNDDNTTTVTTVRTTEVDYPQ